MEHPASFGYWLRRRRKALDLTQEELARCAGCALGTIKSIEGDERRPSKQLAARLADCLELAVFGAPLAHEDDAERAVRAALALRDIALGDDPTLPLQLHLRQYRRGIGDRAWPAGAA